MTRCHQDVTVAHSVLNPVKPFWKVASFLFLFLFFLNEPIELTAFRRKNNFIKFDAHPVVFVPSYNPWSLQ